MRTVVVSSTALVGCAGLLAVSWLVRTPPERVAVLDPKPSVLDRDELRRELEREDKERKRLRPSVHRLSVAELEERNRVAGAESAKVLALAALKAQNPSLVSVPGKVWVPLGPTNAFKQFNGREYAGVDSGRPNNIVSDPRDPNVVYMAVSGGGVWKTFDLLTGPHWAPILDLQPNLAVGSLTIDPANPDTLYLGSGDAFDFAGNTVQKTTDGGTTWSAPVRLSGTYPAPNGRAAPVRDIRSIAVNGSTVFAGTNGGLFKSTDGGASFALVDLPNPNRVLIESIWNVLHIGGGQWVATGVTSCDETSGSPPLAFGEDPGAGCLAGNNGKIWRSDDGTTWTQVTTPSALVGRMTISAGNTSNPATTPIYAMVGQTDNFATIGVWRSLDGGRTWANATGTLANPTLPQNGRQDCASMDMGHDQTWYNQAIIVDPTNANNVLFGGNLCGARTRNGGAAAPTWELVSHWLPAFDLNKTATGMLPYVHADWHTIGVGVHNGQVRTFAGTDGGIFSSTNLWGAGTQAESVQWTHHNLGLATHLFYSVASGDPVAGDPFVLYGGLQDNGTRFRVTPDAPTVFNQPLGGDGIGATVHHSSSGTTYWASIQFQRRYCRPAMSNCAEAGWGSLEPVLGDPREDSAEELEKDRLYALELPGGDEEPFLIHYANVETDTANQNVLTHSVGRIFVSIQDVAGDLSYRAISQDLQLANRGFANVVASRGTPGLYGAPSLQPDIPFYYSATGNTLSNWIGSAPVRPLGATGPAMTRPSSMDFPPVLPAGTTPGQVYIAAFAGGLDNGAAVPDNQGRLYRTTNSGASWTSIVGADAARRLPNVAVWVVKYDPVTPTTIYAGTDIGVYISTDNGASWDRMGEDLPMVSVRDMYVAKNQEFIRIATYGRGLWEIYPSASANHGVNGNGDYDRNQALDWIDVAAMSARTGVTPATTTAPFYTWLLDVVGGVQTIDNNDLAAMLAKLGGRP